MQIWGEPSHLCINGWSSWGSRAASSERSAPEAAARISRSTSLVHSCATWRRAVISVLTGRWEGCCTGERSRFESFGKLAGLHVAVGTNGRVRAHLDTYSPFAGAAHDPGCRYSPQRVVAHVATRLSTDLFRFLFWSPARLLTVAAFPAPARARRFSVWTRNNAVRPRGAGPGSPPAPDPLQCDR